MGKPWSRIFSKVPFNFDLCSYKSLDPCTRRPLVKTLRRDDSDICLLYDIHVGMPHAFVMREQIVTVFVTVVDYARIANADLVSMFILKRS